MCFLKLLIFFENFYGAHYIFPVTSPVSKIFAFLCVQSPICRYMFQLDFSVIFER